MGLYYTHVTTCAKVLFSSSIMESGLGKKFYILQLDITIKRALHTAHAALNDLKEEGRHGFSVNYYVSCTLNTRVETSFFSTGQLAMEYWTKIPQLK